LDIAEGHGTLDHVASVYSAENDRIYEGTGRPGPRLVTMAGVLGGDSFPLAETLRFLLEVGKAGFTCETEIEFAFLQIRPMVFGGEFEDVDLGGIEPKGAIVLSDGALGHGHIGDIRDIVYVDRRTFDRSKSVETAAEIGTLNARLAEAGRPYLLIGPGRWGSADPWLGIPVRWRQISRARCIVETELPDIKVEPSQGTHFFQNITSFGVSYFTVSGSGPGAFIDETWLDAQPAESATASVRHLAFDQPLLVAANSKTGHGVVLKPGVSLAVRDDE
jgi:hypothetical protein